MVLTGRRYRLALTSDQAELCEAVGGICRSVWNTALEQRREYRRRDAWINYQQQAGELADAKCEHEWLKQAPSRVLQQTLMDLDRACRERGTWKVRWRGKSGRYRWSPSLRFPAGKQITVERLGKRWGRCKLPKLGWVRFRWTRAPGGEVRSATVSREGADWFVSFLVETATIIPEKHAWPGTGVGIDRGVAVGVATSDGHGYDRDFGSDTGERTYLRLQRRLARQKKGSANRRRTLREMGRIKRRERNRRQDFCNQVGRRIAADHALVVLENLPTQNMTRSARGTLDQPGTRVAQKSGLNRSILDKGWHMLELAIRNAARTTGSTIVKIPAAWTSQRCSQCHLVDPASRESQARFRCSTCGYCENADVNAAQNILAAGRKETPGFHAVTACGELSTMSMKQEPAGNREGVPIQLALLVGIRRL